MAEREVDAVWRELKAACAALRSAKNQTERGKAITQTQTFLSDDRRRRLVHKWCAWGLLLSSLLHVVKSDAQSYLNAPSGSYSRARTKGALAPSPAGKKPRRTKTGATAPKLEYWTYLRNEFAALHAHDAPALHLDANGRECLTQLFEFAVVVVGREPEHSEDQRIAAKLEDEAWRTLELVARFRVYCAVVSATHLHDVIEFALASLEHGSEIGLASRATLRVDVVQRILAHAPFDLHELLPRLLAFCADWFAAVGIGSDFVPLANVDDVASRLLQTVTRAARANAAAAALPVLQHGVSILHFIQRVWRSTKFHVRAHHTEFMTLFLSFLASHAPEFLLREEIRTSDSSRESGVAAVVLVVSDAVALDASVLHKTLRALLAMLLHAKEIQSLLLNAKLARGLSASVGSAAGTGGTTNGLGSSAGVAGVTSSSSSSNSGTGANGIIAVLLELEHPIASYMQCAADAIFHHDRLLAALLEHEATQQQRGALTGFKRARPRTTTLAWETLLDNVCIPTESTDAATQTTPVRASPPTASTGVQKQHAAWLLLVLTLWTRHGAFYIQNRIGDVMTILTQLVQFVLECKAIEQRQYVGLSLVVQLSHLAAQHRRACSDVLDELWQRVWRQLLRIDLPFAHATASAVLSKDSPGDVVLHVLGNLLAFRLVPLALVHETQHAVSALAVFSTSTTRVAALTAARAASGSSVVVPSAAPVRLLGALLRCVELHGVDTGNTFAPPVAAALSPAASSQVPIDRSDGFASHSLRATLLAVLFAHLDMQIALVTTPTARTIPAIAYASTVVAFLQPATTTTLSTDDGSWLYYGSRFVSNLLQKLAQRSGTTRDDCDSVRGVLARSDLDGFGVHFTSHEDGLATMFANDLETLGPHRFAVPISEYMADNTLASRSGIQRPSLSSSSNSSSDKPSTVLDLPAALLAPLIEHTNRNASVFDFCVTYAHQYADAPSISQATQAALHRDVTRHFGRLLSDLAATLRVGAAEMHACVHTIARAMHVGVVLACLWTELPRASGRDVSNNNNDTVDVAQLLQDFLSILADHLTTAAFARAQEHERTATDVVEILMQFHALILILQGKPTLVACAHPSADPVDLQFPSELRSSIRQVVSVIEAGVTLLAQPASSTTTESQAMMASAPAGFTTVGTNSSSDWMAAAAASSTSSSSSQHQLTAPAGNHEQLFRDAFDDTTSHERSTTSRRTTARLQHTISLWCFRVLLRLKKANGLRTVRALAPDLQFPPDYMLALATLLCGVAGSDSLELVLKLVDYAADDVSPGGVGIHKRSSSSSDRTSDNSSSFRVALFHSQALTVLQLAGLMHERRTLQHKEDVPQTLLQSARRYLDASVTAITMVDALPLTLRIDRKADIECLEVYFRLDLETFGNFVDKCMLRLLDDDFGVRMVAARGIRSWFHMYPDGGSQLFKDVFNSLLPILPWSCHTTANDASDALTTAATPRETGSIDVGVTVALALYVSAWSSDDVVADVLVAFVRLASSDALLYASPASTFLHTWLDAIAQTYAYATPQRLLDDHFCYVWSQFLAMSVYDNRSANDDDDDRHTSETTAAATTTTTRTSASELLMQFPMTLFTGTTTTAHRVPHVAALYTDKVDVLLPVGVLFDALSDYHSSNSSSSSSSIDAFPFVNDLVAAFAESTASLSSSSQQFAFDTDAAVEEQLITDLFALAFVLQVSTDAALQDIAARMLSVAEPKAATNALSLAHLGHVVCKIAQFTVWDLARASDEPSDPARFATALTALKTKYSGFDWTRMHVTELLCAFYELLLRSSQSAPLSTRAVHCFALFVHEILSALESNVVLQQLLLRICFQALQQLAWTPHQPLVAAQLTQLVRDACTQFLKTPDVFGKYLSFVVHEIADTLVRASAASTASRSTTGDDVRRRQCSTSIVLSDDDKGHLEWVVFAVCNDMANGLGKYILDIDAVPTGVCASLDKLNALIAGSRDVSAAAAAVAAAATSDATSNHNTLTAAATSSASALTTKRARRQLEAFVKRANDVGTKFYDQSRLVRASASSIRSDPAAHEPRVASASLLRLATVEQSVSEMLTALDDALTHKNKAPSASAAISKLTTTLFHLSSHQQAAAAATDATQAGSDVLVAIADALSAVGALDKHQFDLSPGADAALLSRLHHEQFHRGALRETKVNFVAAMHERVLNYLSALLFDERVVAPDVVQLAVQTIKRVLRCSEGNDALHKCRDSDLREFLGPFLDSPPSNWSSSSLVVAPPTTTDRTTTSQHRSTLQSLTTLWTAGSAMGYDAWVRATTAALAAAAMDPVLRECARLVAVRTDLAVFLFPYAIWSVMQQRSSSAAAASQSSSPSPASQLDSPNDLRRAALCVQTGLNGILKRAARAQTATSRSAIDDANVDNAMDDDDDSDVAAEPLELVQLVVHSVTFLREIEKAQFVESNGKHLVAAASASSSDGSSAPPTSSSSNRPGNRSQHQQQRRNPRAYGCVVDVDLLDVALAAIRVQMPYSAMQYVEMWLEHARGGTIPLSLGATESSDRRIDASDDNNDDWDDRVRRILVAAYSFDTNVDSIYGINDARTLASQLVTYKQEQSFTKALPIYDVALQRLGVRSASSSSTHHDATLLEGMLQSLRSLGYETLLQGFVASLSSAPAASGANAASSLPASSSSTQIDEYKYELAWKNLQWGAAGTSLSPAAAAASTARNTTERLDGAASPYCHQRVLFQSLKALAHRDTAHVASLLHRSKQDVLASVQLGLCGLESTRDSYRALRWLEAIRDIEETARVVVTIESDAATAGFDDGANDDAATNVSPNARARPIAVLFDQWQQRYPRIAHDFDAVDSLLTLQQVLVTLTPDAPPALLARLHLSHAAFSRKANRVAVAYSALAKLEALHARGQLGTYERMQWHMERAKLLWTQHETRSAIWTAKRLRDELVELLATRTDDNAVAAAATTTVLSAADSSALELLHVTLLTTTGKWIASQRSENSQVVLEEYFQRATDCVDALDATTAASLSGSGAAAKAHLALADYMADMHQQVATRVTSREWLAGKRVAEARHRELDECNAMPEDKRMANRAHIHALKQEVLFDNEERAKVEDSVTQFLTGALSSYGRGLALSPKPELAVVFRLLALWFANQRRAETNAAIHDVIAAVPSYKFVPLSYQIMSRIGSPVAAPASGANSHERFQHVLRKLVLKLCQQHPHHALVQLLALKNNGDVEGKGAREFRANVGDCKSDAAKSLVDELRASPQRALLESLDILAHAYIQLALFDTREYHNKSKKIPLAKVPVHSLATTGSTPAGVAAVPFDQCLRDRTMRRGSGANRTVMPAVLTCHVAPRADLDYASVVRVLSFEPMFTITDSGIHRPKIIYCYGSNGRRYKQLVKGQDDTRQDLVIEQAFETVNQFLAAEPTTQQRNLRLRTYKVVPLSPIAGVLEWVDHTIPWGSYLVGRTSTKRLSAHERYHPREWKHVACRTALKNAAPNDKLATYDAITRHFTPVFHHFFLEQFPDPAMWFAKRLAYVQSVAVTSIVGYILGIGDRHSQNILVHEETAELVHIDFGVVFDQGMALLTPETVPFRLTRDIVDGMGVAGVDGVFTRCCEATLALLRKKRASVVTILEVFVHDPLYRWTLSPLKALKIQEERTGGGGGGHARRSRTSAVEAIAAAAAAAGRPAAHASSLSAASSLSTATASGDDNDDGNAAHPPSSSSRPNNDAAARALLRVAQKLDGYEDPSGGNALSIEGQVKQLISAAQDPRNLCTLFPGWAPWL